MLILTIKHCLMAKKKNSQFLPGLLEDIMSLLTPEEQEIAI